MYTWSTVSCFGRVRAVPYYSLSRSKTMCRFADGNDLKPASCSPACQPSETDEALAPSSIRCTPNIAALITHITEWQTVWQLLSCNYTSLLFSPVRNVRVPHCPFFFFYQLCRAPGREGGWLCAVATGVAYLHVRNYVFFWGRRPCNWSDVKKKKKKSQNKAFQVLLVFLFYS